MELFSVICIIKNIIMCIWFLNVYFYKSPHQDPKVMVSVIIIHIRLVFQCCFWLTMKWISFIGTLFLRTNIYLLSVNSSLHWAQTQNSDFLAYDLLFHTTHFSMSIFNVGRQCSKKKWWSDKKSSAGALWLSQRQTAGLSWEDRMQGTFS